MHDTMRRIRAYKTGTEVRGKSRQFQGKMLIHLVQIKTRPKKEKS